MTEPANNLQKLLEQATSSGPVKLDSLSPEARELREAWTGWSELLTRADQSWDERQVLATLAENTSPRQARSRWLAAALALSLTLLIGVALGQLDFLTRQVAVDDAARLARASPGDSQSPGSMPAGDVPDNGADEDGSELLTWNDSFDERLAEARETLTSIHASWHSSSNSQAWLEQQMSDLRSDLEDGSL